MEGPHSNLTGSLNSLMIFEASVRHGGFTAAAQALRLTQPNVSRHVAQLEARIGRPLFYRRNNRIEPTADGRRLSDAVALGFAHVEAAWTEIAGRSDTADIVLACSYGFADQWLLPRFNELQKALPDIRVRVVTSDWMDSLDLSRIDVAITSNPELSPGRIAIPLGAEIAFPVCSPAYLRRMPGLDRDPPSLLDADLLSFDVGTSGFLTWEAWFVAVGLPPPSNRAWKTFDAYPFMLRAAVDGAGVALGWNLLVDQLIACGDLVRVGPEVSNLENAYYLQHRALGDAKKGATELVAWFRGALDLADRS